MTEKETVSLPAQHCPMCNKKTLTLSEIERDIPFFGKVFIFGMNCSNCNYKKSDVESAEQKEPCKYTFEVAGKDDLDVRVVRSSEGLIKLAHVGELEPGTNAEGFVSNIESVLLKFKQQIEHLRDSEEDLDAKKKAKNMIKKLQKVLWGSEKLKITIEDPSGNSAIISDKAVKTKL